VNTTARLSSVAKAGELLVSVVSAEHAGLDPTGLERRTVDLRGREAGLDVYSMLPGAITGS
jgi:adenylate cyclase